MKMRLIEYIDRLNKFLTEHGDMDVYYASDDEGNEYQKVNHCGSLFFISECEKKRRWPSLIDYNDTEYINEVLEDGDELIPVCVVN
jgi:hypothetical protein